MPKIVLASQSTSRRQLLEGAGLKPVIELSEVDEETDFFNAMSPADMVIALAFGKPGTPEVARERARKISGRSGLLHTGHCIIDTEQGREIADRVTTKVTFSELTDDEIEDYIKSGEPLQVAGGFTLDGYGSPFIPIIEGDYTNVVGISMPFLRSAMTQLGYSWPEVKEMR
jgi:septum formation protein